MHRTFLGSDQHAALWQELHRPEMRQALRYHLLPHLRHLGGLGGTRLLGKRWLLIGRVRWLRLDGFPGGHALVACGWRRALGHLLVRRGAARTLGNGRGGREAYRKGSPGEKMCQRFHRRT